MKLVELFHQSDPEEPCIPWLHGGGSHLETHIRCVLGIVRISYVSRLRKRRCTTTPTAVGQRSKGREHKNRLECCVVTQTS